MTYHNDLIFDEDVLSLPLLLLEVKLALLLALPPQLPAVQLPAAALAALAALVERTCSQLLALMVVGRLESRSKLSVLESFHSCKLCTVRKKSLKQVRSIENGY